MTKAAEQWYTDRTHVATNCYPDSTNLQNRANLYHYQHPPLDLVSWAIDQISWRGNEQIVDVGCGPGKYLRRLNQFPDFRLVGFDISHGMLYDLLHNWNTGRDEEPIQPTPHVAVADAQDLPLPNASCDVVLAMHMLYHVSDIMRALREMQRVLRSNGTLVVMTNRGDHLWELIAAGASALTAVIGYPAELFSPAPRRFQLENGEEMLRDVFGQVERRDVERPVVISQVAPILAYIESTRTVTEKLLPDGASWDAVMYELERHVTAIIMQQGSFRVTSATGLFICRKC